MVRYLLRRLLYMIVILVLVSVVSFVVIQLPPGDYISSYVTQLTASGSEVSEQEIESLRQQYGLGLPWYEQYFKWILNMLKGNFGRSFLYDKPVLDLLIEHIPLTILLSLCTLVFTYAVAIPLGIYAATHQYSSVDYVIAIIGFAGLAIPNFLFALLLMVFLFQTFGLSIGGFFSPQYVKAAWSMGRFIDFLKHLPAPIIVIGTAGTAGIIRVMRGCLLDELKKQYVITARAKGVSEQKLLYKYPTRIALNPIVSTIGFVLPHIVSGVVIVSIVLNLPTVGPLLLQALLNQDMFLAGDIVMLLSFLTVIGMFLSDIVLALIDPRIRLEK
jgi:peptide/nickel transport system permease protein